MVPSVLHRKHGLLCPNSPVRTVLRAVTGQRCAYMAMPLRDMPTLVSCAADQVSHQQTMPRIPNAERTPATSLEHGSGSSRYPSGHIVTNVARLSGDG